MNGKPVLSFRKSTDVGDAVYDSRFENITHVFIERNEN
jgi:hypothetical protein